MTLSHFAPNSMIRAGLVVPVLIAGLWMVRSPMSAQRIAFAFSPSQAEGVQPADAEEVATVAAPAAVERVGQQIANETLTPVESRKARIAQLLETLDQIASVTQQMSPERAATIEPVLVDLAERTLDLSEIPNLQKVTTDSKLTHIETTVEKLVKSLNDTVAPEVSL